MTKFHSELNEPLLYNIDQCAERIWGDDKSTKESKRQRIYRLIETGYLKSKRTGKRHYFPRAEVLRFCQQID